jgi:Domain of unknown function (DUF5753)/Domain of unknown function (DUF397)
MAEQLDHLLAMTELAHVTVQVLPSEFGAHGMMSGSVQLLRFVDNEDAAYAESVLGIEPVQDPNAVVVLSTLWNGIASAAPSPEQSREMIRAERKSASNAQCVEMQHTLTQARDSQNIDGDVLRADFSALVAAVKSGRIG